MCAAIVVSQHMQAVLRVILCRFVSCPDPADLYLVWQDLDARQLEVITELWVATSSFRFRFWLQQFVLPLTGLYSNKYPFGTPTSQVPDLRVRLHDVQEAESASWVDCLTCVAGDREAVPVSTNV